MVIDFADELFDHNLPAFMPAEAGATNSNKPFNGILIQSGRCANSYSNSESVLSARYNFVNFSKSLIRRGIKGDLPTTILYSRINAAETQRCQQIAQASN